MEVGSWQSFAYFWPEVALAASALAVALLAVLGLDLMASAVSLWIAFLSVELASLTLWTLLHEPQAGEAPVPGRRSVRGVGAAMLCGTAWLAGFSQSGDYEDVHRAVFE